MAFSPEIKNFTKNTLILTLLFAVALHFGWGYLSSLFTASVGAQNDKNFERANIIYIGNIATALSLNLGGAGKSSNQTVGGFTNTTISVSEVLNNPASGQSRLIASNMSAITTYSNILQTNIRTLLENTSNRAGTLDNYITLLQSYEVKATTQLETIREQKVDIHARLQASIAQENDAKSTLQGSYNSLDYTGVDAAISQYVEAKNTTSRLKIYLIYLDRFEQSYRALQTRSHAVLATLQTNRDTLIAGNTVVIPDRSEEIVRELGLIQDEADAKTQALIQ